MKISELSDLLRITVKFTLKACVVNRLPIDVRSSFLNCIKYPSTIDRKPLDVARRRNISSIVINGMRDVYNISSQLKLSKLSKFEEEESRHSEILESKNEDVTLHSYGKSSIIIGASSLSLSFVSN